MKTHIIYFVVTALILAGCKNSDHEKTMLPYNIDLEKDIGNIKSIPLSTIGSKLEYIPLETDSECLIERVSNVFVTDSFIFVSDYDRLLLFDINGNYIRQIGTKGRGPGEYTSVGDFIIDNEQREIYILSSRMVLVYDFEGRFKRDFNLDFPGRQFIMDENDNLILHPFNIPQPTTDTVYSWYIYDKTGTIRTKLLNTLKRVNGGVIVPFSPLYTYNGTPHFMEFGVDTLYNYANNQKTAYAIFHYGNMKFPPDPTMSEVPGIDGKIWISDIRETKKLLFVNVWWNMSGPISNCVFDKKSSTFTVLKDNSFDNDIDGNMHFWPEKIINDNLMIDYIDAFDLITYARDNNTESKQLKEVLEKLTETSNPVLIILKN
jgi:hypothetical protein